MQAQFYWEADQVKVTMHHSPYLRQPRQEALKSSSFPPHVELF